MTMENGERIVTLARRLLVGDLGAYEELLVELEPLVVRTVRLVIGSGSWVAEDAAQEAFLDVARGLERVRRPEAVLAWAIRVATRRALKVARRDRLLSLGRAPGIEPELLAAIAPETKGERINAIKNALDGLSLRLRATAVLRLYLELSEAESAAILGCSIGTVKSNLHDARRKLADSLRGYGVAPSTSPTCREEISQ